MDGLMDREAQSICMSISDIDIDPSLFTLGTLEYSAQVVGVFALGYAVHMRDRSCQNNNGLPKLDGGREVAFRRSSFWLSGFGWRLCGRR